MPRHQTLTATLDWSYNLIGERERCVLQRLSVFVGAFTLEEARAVAACDTVDGAEVIETLADLVAKSLVSADRSEAFTRYRLLDTTRGYARGKLVASGEDNEVCRRHALYYQELFGRVRTEPALVPSGVFIDPHRLGNVRAALDWSFSATGDMGVGVRLAAVAALLLIEICQLNECERWSERALAALNEDTHDPWCEMVLRASLGHVRMFAKGNSKDAHVALETALALAERLDNPFYQLRLLSALHTYHRRSRDFARLPEIAHRATVLAPTIGNTAASAAACAMMAIAHFHNGDLKAAKAALDGAPKVLPEMQGAAHFFGIGRDGDILYPRLLWQLGFPDQAAAAAHAVVGTQESNPLTRCLALITAAGVFQLRGDRDFVEDYTDQLIHHARDHSLGPFESVGMGFRGETLFLSGEIEAGLDLARNALNRLRAERYDNYTPWLSCILAQALAARGQIDQGLALMKEALNVLGPDAYNAPETLRIHGEMLALAGDAAEAQRFFRDAIAIADKQGALSLRLRTVTSLVRLRMELGRHDGAGAQLAETYARFTEGFDTADLKAAKRLLNELGAA